MTDPAATYLAHIVSRIQSDVHFLVDQGRLAPHDASAFLARLPSGTQQQQQPQAPQSLASAVSTGYAPPSGPPTPAWAPPTARVVPPPPAPKSVCARALWAYNEKGAVRHFFSQIALSRVVDCSGLGFLGVERSHFRRRRHHRDRGTDQRRSVPLYPLRATTRLTVPVPFYRLVDRPSQRQTRVRLPLPTYHPHSRPSLLAVSSPPTTSRRSKTPPFQ
jgi:hypothetical protein